MKKLILFSTFVLMLISCTPSRAGIHETIPTASPIYPSLQATAESSQPPVITEVASSTAFTPSSLETTAVYPVTGSVEIEEGRCCIGGFDGETIEARVHFFAVSPFGAVNRMRAAARCSGEAGLENADWEPFQESKSYPVHVVLNWSGFHICAQYQDEYGNLSPVYRDDISVEGFPRSPLVNPTDWYPQIQCFSEQEVQPGAGEVVTGSEITFHWPDKNNLPEGVFYKAFVYGVEDNPTGLAASGQTRETSITLPVAPESAGELGWYVVLVDANGTLLDHSQCSSFPASLLTVDPPVGLKAVLFRYQP